MLKIYQVKLDYIKALSTHESKVQFNPGGNYDNKPYIGVLFEIDEKQYIVPISSPKQKHRRMSNGLDFYKLDSGKLGALNFNNMIPVSDKAGIFQERDINALLNSKNIDEVKYGNLLNDQIKLINQKDISSKIIKKANDLYNRFINNNLPERIKNRCIDFIKLEDVLDQYLLERETKTKPSKENTMYLLIASQENDETMLGAFNNQEDLQAFKNKLPNYQKINQDEWITETFQCNSDLEWIQFNNHQVPLTQHMFVEDQEIQLYEKEIANLSTNGNGIISGATRVDAYIINNEDLEDYIHIREYGIAQVLKSLSDLGYVGHRAYRGSQDGEAILYHKPYQEEIHFLCHCDPIFVQDIKDNINNITQYVKEMMNL